MISYGHQPERLAANFPSRRRALRLVRRHAVRLKGSGARTMNGRFVVALGLTIIPLFADAQEHDGSYYCVTELSGGLAYNKTLKRWESTRFRPNDKFVVQFEYVGPHQSDYGGKSYTDDYLVTITESGSDKREACKTYYMKASDRIQFTRGTQLRGDCQTLLNRYQFNLENKRFLAVFESGAYVIGMDQEGSDTPSISGGTCTKIK
jgi:hypothetical protein